MTGKVSLNGADVNTDLSRCLGDGINMVSPCASSLSSAGLACQRCGAGSRSGLSGELKRLDTSTGVTDSSSANQRRRSSRRCVLSDITPCCAERQGPRTCASSRSDTPASTASSLLLVSSRPPSRRCASGCGGGSPARSEGSQTGAAPHCTRVRASQRLNVGEPSRSSAAYPRGALRG